MKHRILIDELQIDDIEDQIVLEKKLSAILEGMNLRKERVIVKIYDEEKEVFDGQTRKT